MPFCPVGKNSLFYEEKGSGIPVIFIHPPGMGRKVFRYQHLLSNRFRVIFPDLSGHGDTIGQNQNVSIKGFADEIVGLLDGLKIKKAVICGYSSGGIVVQEFALSFPERTLGVILSGGFAEVKSAIFRYEHLLGMYFVKRYPRLLASVIAAAHTMETGFREELAAHMDKADPKVWFRFYEESLHYSCEERLDQLQAPLLLIYGSKDFTNQHLRAYKKRTDYQAAIIKNAFHQLPVKNWKLFNQIVTGFIEENIKPPTWVI